VEKMNEKKRSKQIYIDPEIHREIKVLATQNEMLIKEVVEELWKEYKKEYFKKHGVKLRGNFTNT
jgi:hypothetical protein